VRARIPWGHAVRDSLVVAATLVLWALDGRIRADGTAWGLSTAVGAGALTAVSGYLFHEWGHLAGALAARARIRLPDSPWEIFLFNFDVDRNQRRQFVAMSIGGYAASAAYVVFLAFVMPLDTTAGVIAAILVGAGMAATAILELPPFFRVLRGGALPSEGAAYVSDANRNETR
jgi:hypothetical protein